MHGRDGTLTPIEKQTKIKVWNKYYKNSTTKRSARYCWWNFMLFRFTKYRLLELQNLAGRKQLELLKCHNILIIQLHLNTYKVMGSQSFPLHSGLLANYFPIILRVHNPARSLFVWAGQFWVSYYQEMKVDLAERKQTERKQTSEITTDCQR